VRGILTASCCRTALGYRQKHLLACHQQRAVSWASNPLLSKLDSKPGLVCRGAFIPFLVAGDPDLDTTAAAIRELDRAGADVIELGVPYSVGGLPFGRANRADRAVTNLSAPFSLTAYSSQKSIPWMSAALALHRPAASDNAANLSPH